MHMAKSSEEILKLLEEYSRIVKGEQRLAVVKKEPKSQIKRRAILRDQVAIEYQDIVDLEKSSLRALFSRVLKSREEQLEKERQEYLLATIEYDECQHLIESLEYELKILSVGASFIMKSKSKEAKERKYRQGACRVPYD